LDRQSFQGSTCIGKLAQNFLDEESVLLSSLIEMVLPCLTPESFILRNEYTLKHSLDTVHGKWPEQLGNGFFIESEYLLHDFIDMLVESVHRPYKEQSFGR
jgi:hypothetical protein